MTSNVDEADRMAIENLDKAIRMYHNGIAKERAYAGEIYAEFMRRQESARTEAKSEQVDLADNIKQMETEFAVYSGMKMTAQSAHDLYYLAKRQSPAINQLVELVAEMRDTLEFYTFAKGERLADFINRMEADVGMKADLAANKADALLNNLGEV